MTAHASDKTILDWLAEHATEVLVSRESEPSFLLEWRAPAGNRVHITGLDLREVAARAMDLHQTLEKGEDPI